MTRDEFNKRFDHAVELLRKELPHCSPQIGEDTIAKIVAPAELPLNGWLNLPHEIPSLIAAAVALPHLHEEYRRQAWASYGIVSRVIFALCSMFQRILPVQQTAAE